MNIQDIPNFSVKGTNAQVRELAGMLEKVGIVRFFPRQDSDGLIDVKCEEVLFCTYSDHPDAEYPLKTYTEAKAIIESINKTEKTMSKIDTSKLIDFKCETQTWDEQNAIMSLARKVGSSNAGFNGQRFAFLFFYCFSKSLNGDTRKSLFKTNSIKTELTPQQAIEMLKQACGETPEYKKGDKVIITKAYDVNSKVGWICSIIVESSVDCFFASCPDGKNWYIGAPDVNFKHGETPAKPKRKRQADEVEIKHNGIVYTATGWGGHTIADVAELDNTALASIAETEQTIKEYKAEISTLRKGIRARNEQRKYHGKILSGEIISNGFTTKRRAK